MRTNVTHVYIGKAPCGCMVAFVVDDPEHLKDTAEAVSEFIRYGYLVERLSIENARNLLHLGHNCGKAEIQQVL